MASLVSMESYGKDMFAQKSGKSFCYPACVDGVLQI